MKITTVFLFLIISSGLQARIIKLPKNDDGGLYKPRHNAQPGDTILLEGDYAYIFLENIQGASDKPVTILNHKQVRIGIKSDNYSFLLVNCNYIHVDGTGSGLQYGMLIGSATNGRYNAQGLSFSGNNIEINGVEIHNTQLGFFSNPKTGGPWKNIKIHHNYVHGLDNPKEGGRTEGVYIGNTDPSTYISSGSFDSVEIAYNLFEELSGDGIQVARTRNLKIHNNEIKKYGKANLEQQRSAIVIGGCSSGAVFNNKISDGTGAAIQVFGSGNVSIVGNKIQRTASSANEDVIYINCKCLDGPKLRVRINNNIIDKAARDFVKDANITPSIIEKKGNQFGKKPTKKKV